MALCGVHAAAGYLVYEAVRPAGGHRVGMLALAVLLANAPDGDFLPGLLLGQPTLHHRGFTHTLAAVAVTAAVAWCVGGRGPLRGLGRPRCAALLAGAWASHLVVDWLTVDAVPPHGARFLWPLWSGHLHAPLPLFGEIVVDPSSTEGFVRSLGTPSALRAWAGEAVIVLSAPLVPLLLRGSARRRPAVAWAPASRPPRAPE